jgi:hypothetical protein
MAAHIGVMGLGDDCGEPRLPGGANWQGCSLGCLPARAQWNLPQRASQTRKSLTSSPHLALIDSAVAADAFGAASTIGAQQASYGLACRRRPRRWQRLAISSGPRPFVGQCGPSSPGRLNPDPIPRVVKVKTLMEPPLPHPPKILRNPGVNALSTHRQFGLRC